MRPFLNLRTAKFPVQAGEEQEIINPGTFGKSFAQYIETTLKSAGFEVPFIVCEDWGWWVEVKLADARIGILCYREHDENGDCGYSCSLSPEKDSAWSWSKFRFVDLTTQLDKIHRSLCAAFQSDPEIQYLGESDEPNFC